MSDILRRVRYLPIRHHSPISSLRLEREIESRPPRCVLVEGPVDAAPLIPVLLDPGTIPPVAIFAHDGSKSVVYPFARYSPEYAALRIAARLGIPARFIDIPTSAAMALGRGTPERREERSWAGYRSFDEFWEATFEAGEASVDLLLDFAKRMRRSDDLDRVREAHMAREIDKEGDETLVVCGAFHAAALAEGDVDRSCPVPEGPAVDLSIVPTSFARISEQAGYGAGNRAPFFYQRVYEANGDFRRAALATIVDLGTRLRHAGNAVGLADTIEAFRLARTLGSLREKPAPGVEEVREAAVACLLRGAAGRWIQDVLVGDEVGRVAARIGGNPLQREFLAEVQRRGLPLVDAPREIRLRLGDPPDIGTSAFLHRSRIAQVPYAELRSATNARERWRVRWSPAVDRALGESLRMGETLERVCESRILEGIGAAGAVGSASDHLREIVVADIGRILPMALDRCRDLSVADGDLYSLARAGETFRNLRTLGAIRHVPAEEIDALLRLVTARALSALGPAAAVAGEGVPRVCTALKILVDLTRADPDPFRRAAVALIDDGRTHPRVAGLVVALLSDPETLRIQLARRRPPLEAARFLEGLLSVRRHGVVRDRTIVGALDEYVKSLEEREFRAVLPVLRRAFAGMSKGEVRYLLESLQGEDSRTRYEVALSVGLKGQSTLATVAEALRTIDLARLHGWVPERIGHGSVEVPPRSFEELQRETDRFRFARSVMRYCSQASLAELRRSQARLWSDAEARPFVIAALRARPDVAADLALRTGGHPIAGRIAIELGSEEVLRRLVAERPPVCYWAEETLRGKSAASLRQAKRALYADRIKAALWAPSSRDRAAAVSELGQTRDPLFAPTLRRASEDASAAVRDEAAVALARIGHVDDLERWIRDRRWRALGQLREARGLAALVAAASAGAPGAIAALKEAGDDAIDAVLDRPWPRLLSLWDPQVIEERRRRR